MIISVILAVLSIVAFYLITYPIPEETMIIPDPTEKPFFPPLRSQNKK